MIWMTKWIDKKPLGIVAQVERKSSFFLFSPMHCTESPSSGNTHCHGTSVFFAPGFETSILTTLLSYIPYSVDVHPPCICISHNTVSHLLWSRSAASITEHKHHWVSARCWPWLPPLSSTFPQHMKRLHASEATQSILHGLNVNKYWNIFSKNKVWVIHTCTSSKWADETSSSRLWKRRLVLVHSQRPVPRTPITVPPRHPSFPARLGPPVPALPGCAGRAGRSGATPEAAPGGRMLQPLQPLRAARGPHGRGQRNCTGWRQRRWTSRLRPGVPFSFSFFFF